VISFYISALFSERALARIQYNQFLISREFANSFRKTMAAPADSSSSSSSSSSNRPHLLHGLTTEASLVVDEIEAQFHQLRTHIPRWKIEMELIDKRIAQLDQFYHIPERTRMQHARSVRANYIRQLEDVTLLQTFVEQAANVMRTFGLQTKAAEDTQQLSTTGKKRKKTTDGSTTKYLKSAHATPVSNGVVASSNASSAVAVSDALTQLRNLNLFESAISTPFTTRQQFCKCGRPYLFRPKEATLTCDKCTVSIPILDNSSTSFSYSYDIEHSQFAYDRFTHWMDEILPFRPTKRVHIDQAVKNKIKALIRLNRFGFRDGKIDFAKMFLFLKALGLRDLYKHKYQLTMDMTNTYWPVITEATEQISTTMFLVAQDPYEEKKGIQDRTSFVNYGQFGRDVFRILGIHHTLPFFMCLETKECYIDQFLITREVFYEMNPNIRIG